MLGLLIELTEQGWIPDPAIRWGVRKMCQRRHAMYNGYSARDIQDHLEKHIQLIRSSAEALHTEDANRQHYEVPARFYELVLGPYLKYSCGYWADGVTSLEDSEREALRITMERADLKDGQKILELGCGWGSLTLSMAHKFPHAQITAVSNSHSQRESIMKKAHERGLKNIEVLTQDLGIVKDLGAGKNNFDRIVSVEMFEHIRNYEAFFEKLSSWLAPDGKLFFHIFTHKNIPYVFETEGDDNWMGRYFFTGGQMPTPNLMEQFQTKLRMIKTWNWNGQHYQKTSEAWLKNMDLHENKIREALLPVYGRDQVDRWIQRWRLFFIAVAELFGYHHGEEWGVTHFLFEKRPSADL